MEKNKNLWQSQQSILHLNTFENGMFPSICWFNDFTKIIQGKSSYISTSAPLAPVCSHTLQRCKYPWADAQCFYLAMCFQIKQRGCNLPSPTIIFGVGRCPFISLQRLLVPRCHTEQLGHVSSLSAALRMAANRAMSSQLICSNHGVLGLCHPGAILSIIPTKRLFSAETWLLATERKSIFGDVLGRINLHLQCWSHYSCN